MQSEFVQACVCTSINPTKSSPVFLKKNRNPPACGHITPDPPAPPWSMLLPNACRHPNRNGCFFWTAFQAKRCNNIDLGERGRASFFAMSLKGCFFWRTRTQSGKDFVVYGCANTSLNKLPFALDTTSIQTHSHLQSCYPANKEAQYFFGLWLCKRKLEQIPFCTRQNPIETHFHRHSCYPQTKMCLQKQNCTNCVFRAVHAWYSARPQNAVNTMGLAFFGQLTENVNILSFIGVFSSLFGRINCIYSVLWPCAVACAVRALCKTLQNTMFVPP